MRLEAGCVGGNAAAATRGGSNGSSSSSGAGPRLLKGLSERVAAFYAGCVVLALEHLHGRGVVYRDLKPENVFVDASGYGRLGDFGFAKALPRVSAAAAAAAAAAARSEEDDDDDVDDEDYEDAEGGGEGGDDDRNGGAGAGVVARFAVSFGGDAGARGGPRRSRGSEGDGDEDWHPRSIDSSRLAQIVLDLDLRRRGFFLAVVSVRLGVYQRQRHWDGNGQRHPLRVSHGYLNHVRHRLWHWP